MADTLTVNTDESTSELTTEEKDSLQVGEKITEEQGELLAGKYKNAEDLEKAYVELQKKLGDQDGVSQEGQETQEVEDATKDEPKAEKSEAVSLLESANEEYFSNDKTLSKETLEKFSSLSSQDLVQAYLEMQKTNPTSNQTEVDVNTAEINKIQNSVGGEAEYNKLISWAGSNLSEPEVNAFDDLVGSGNAAAIQLLSLIHI